MLTGAILIVAGIGQLAAAPLAQSCLSSGDMRVCETIGVIVLNVSGVASLLVGLALLAVGLAQHTRHNISA
jgi:hypothetical protein